MATYVEVQGKINDKRMLEYEEQIKQAEAAAAVAAQQQATEGTLSIEESGPVVEAATN